MIRLQKTHGSLAPVDTLAMFKVWQVGIQKDTCLFPFAFTRLEKQLGAKICVFSSI